MRQPNTQTRMQTLLAEIDYDFTNFTMDDFVSWLERCRERPIVFIPREMPATLFGAWVKTADTDYIFFEENAISIHQAHIQLHEMAHMICDHPTVEVQAGPIQAILRAAGPEAFLAHVDALLLRSVRADTAEEEAETLTALIQERALSAKRLAELHNAISQEGDFASYFPAYLEAMERGS